MEKIFIILFIIFILSCDKDDVIPFDECMTCTTIVSEGNVVTDIQTQLFCGEALAKQLDANYSYKSDLSNEMIFVRTNCYEK